MKKKSFLPVLLCLLYAPQLFAQISNTETNITLSSINFVPSQVCQWINPPSSNAGNLYEMYIEYEDGDNFGLPNRMPATGYSSCTVTNTPNAFGANISIDVPTANFPTVNNTIFAWDLVMTRGRVVLKNLTTTTEYIQHWEYDQYVCSALPIFLSSFTVNSNYSSTNYLKFDWTAVDENINLSHYILQRSTNRFHWLDDVLEPAQTGAGNHNYTLYANKPASDSTWYRLKWINPVTGWKGYSEPMAVFNSNGPTSIVCNYTNISGPSSLCVSQSGVYKLHNAPASGAAYSWSVNNGTLTSTQQSGLKANITFNSIANATVNANAANNSCNKSKPVTVGGPGTVTLSVTPTVGSSYTFYKVSVQTSWPGVDSTNYEWYQNGVYVGTGHRWSFEVYPGPCDTIEAKINTSCGLVSGSLILCYQNPACDEPWCAKMVKDQFKVMPVPANDVLTVSMQNDSQDPGIKEGKAAALIYTIQLYDMSGNLKLESRDVSLKTDQRLNISHLPVGNYVLYIQHAGNKISKQIRIQR
jgi:hypothetical protein